jgi:hypothetical protein
VADAREMGVWRETGKKPAPGKEQAQDPEQGKGQGKEMEKAKETGRGMERQGQAEGLGGGG